MWHVHVSHLASVNLLPTRLLARMENGQAAAAAPTTTTIRTKLPESNLDIFFFAGFHYTNEVMCDCRSVCVCCVPVCVCPSRSCPDRGKRVSDTHTHTRIKGAQQALAATPH